MVQRRILDIVESEYKSYTFGSQLPQRVEELWDILMNMHRQGLDISGAKPSTRVVSAMIQARQDIDEFGKRLRVQLPPVC